MGWVEYLRKLEKEYPPLPRAEMESLAVRAAEGDEKAKELLFLHNARRYLMFLDRYLSPPPRRTHGAPRIHCFAIRDKSGKPIPYKPQIDEEELAQVIIEAAWKAIETFEPGRIDFGVYLTVLLYQAVRDFYRKEQRYLRRRELAEALELERDYLYVPDPARVAERELAEEEFMAAAREHLPEELYRELLGLLGREGGVVPRNPRATVKKVREILKGAVPEGTWDRWARALSGA